MDTRLRAEELCMNYNGKQVLDRVSFDVRAGEILAVLGPSGCGKTTLLRVLAGLLEPAGGTVFKDGRDITRLSPGERGIGVVFQNYALFESMTVLENVAYALRIRRENRGRAAQEAVRSRAAELLDQLGLGDHLQKKPRELSGGQQQRVAIARTLVMKPDVILLDEPMSALDAAARLSLREELLRIRQDLGTAMLYITHDQEDAFSLSDRIMVMAEARVVQIGTPEELLRTPADDYVREFVLNNLRRRVQSLASYRNLEA